MEILAESREPLDLTTINNDCKEFIFEYLEFEDLLNIADASKELYESACRTFKRKLRRNGRIEIGLPCDDAYVFLFYAFILIVNWLVFDVCHKQINRWEVTPTVHRFTSICFGFCTIFNMNLLYKILYYC